MFHICSVITAVPSKSVSFRFMIYLRRLLTVCYLLFCLETVPPFPNWKNIQKLATGRDIMLRVWNFVEAISRSL